MFDSTSRYYSLETVQFTVTEPDGTTRQVAYKRRRFIPPANGQTVLVEHIVQQGERLDQITARYLGDPTQFWRVADANGVIDANELTIEPGRVVRIHLSEV
jgi:nucleoid-associated protein YgaU